MKVRRHEIDGIAIDAGVGEPLSASLIGGNRLIDGGGRLGESGADAAETKEKSEQKQPR